MAEHVEIGWGPETERRWGDAMERELQQIVRGEHRSHPKRASPTGPQDVAHGVGRVDKGQDAGQISVHWPIDPRARCFCKACQAHREP